MILHVPSICLPMCLLSKHSNNENFNKIYTYTLTQSPAQIWWWNKRAATKELYYINDNIFPIMLKAKAQYFIFCLCVCVG